jgi:RNA-directed DNA polymerase
VGDVHVLIDRLNPVLHGWGSYFRTGNAAAKFIQVDAWVVWRLKRFLMQGKGRHLRVGEAASRARENRMHGLKGDPMGTHSYERCRIYQWKMS